MKLKFVYLGANNPVHKYFVLSSPCWMLCCEVCLFWITESKCSQPRNKDLGLTKCNSVMWKQFHGVFKIAEQSYKSGIFKIYW